MSSEYSAPAESLFRHLLKATPVILFVSIITLLLVHAGCFARFEMAAFDTWLRLWKPVNVEEIVIVEIDDQGYREIFEEASPLNPQNLWILIEAIADGRPRVIGVDLDTSSDKFEGLAMKPTRPQIVWACDARYDETKALFEPMNVLGTSSYGDLVSGIALLPMDSDGVFRRYRRTFVAKEKEIDSFPWAVVQAYQGEEQSEHAEESLLLNFSGDKYQFKRMNAIHALRLHQSKGWRENGPLLGRIVLLGGVYRAARDEYPTPLGLMAGVHLMGQAIASELHEGGIRHANELWMLFLEIVSGYLVAWLHFRFQVKKAFFLGLAAIPVFAFIGSYLAFSSFSRWANFIPILVSIKLHQNYERAKSSVELLRRTKTFAG